MCRVNMHGTFFSMSQINGNVVHPYLNNNAQIITNSDNLEDNWNNMYNWGLYNGDLASQTMFPGRQQFAEWSQQMLSQMYQNNWNSAPEQMRRAIEAGINPYLAANGIAGSGTSPSQSAPPSAVGAGAAGLNSIASTLGTLGSMASQGVQGFAMLKKLRPEIDKITAETSNIFETMGFTKLQSKALSISLKYMDEKEQLSVWQALANYKRTQAEYKNLRATHRNIIAQYDEIIESKELLIQQQGEVEARKILNQAMADKERAITQWYKDENEFFERHGYRQGIPVYESMRDMMVSDGTFDVDAFGDTISEYDGKVQGAVENARQDAIESHAYNIAYESGRAAYDFDWDAPPKTIAEFLWKGVGNIKSNLKGSIGRLFKRGSDSNQVYEPSKKQLRQEYMSYKQQLDQQYMLLNFRTSDNVDEKGNWKSIDEKIEIMKMRAELDKMPKSYNEWLKYVKSH